MVESARLEIWYGFTSIVGSNPTLSATPSIITVSYKPKPRPIQTGSPILAADEPIISDS